MRFARLTNWLGDRREVMQSSKRSRIGNMTTSTSASTLVGRQRRTISPAGLQFGGDPHACAAKLPLLTDVFDKTDAFDLAALSRLCSDLKINVLVIKDKDGIWDKEPEWLRSLPVLAANRYARIVGIGPEWRAQPSPALESHSSAKPGSPTSAR